MMIIIIIIVIKYKSKKKKLKIRKKVRQTYSKIKVMIINNNINNKMFLIEWISEQKKTKMKIQRKTTKQTLV